MAADTITVTDNRTGKTTDPPILEGTVGQPTVDIGRLNSELGYMSYDAGFVSTASCKSTSPGNLLRTWQLDDTDAVFQTRVDDFTDRPGSERAAKIPGVFIEEAVSEEYDSSAPLVTKAF